MGFKMESQLVTYRDPHAHSVPSYMLEEFVVVYRLGLICILLV